MRASRLSLRRSLLLSTVFSLSLLTTLVHSDTTTSATTAATTTSATSTSDDASTTATSSTSDMPAISSSSSKSTNADMPTLSTTSAADTSIPTYPAPSVPPTQNAPYMQQSNLPVGTVFITVGAILGAFGLTVLLWRAIIACMLHRSVEKAAMAQHLANDKAAFPAPPAPFYKYSDQDSSQNVGSGRGVRRTNRGPIPSATPSQTNLFFSPTAAGPNPRDSVYRDTPDKRESSYRDSRFLPPGFYAAGSSSPANPDGAISLANLRPDSRGHLPAASGHTPPESPGFPPQRSPLPRDMSTSSVNLHVRRAPSAYLDDLLDEHPEMFPPSGSGTSSTPTNTTSTTHPNHPYRQSGRF